MKSIIIKYLIKYLGLVTLYTFTGILPVSASEPKSLVQNILTNPNNCWKDLHLLPSQLIGSMILHNHPIVPFILSRVQVASTLYSHVGSVRSAVFNNSGDRVLTASNGAGDDLHSYATAKLWDPTSRKVRKVLHTLKDKDSHSLCCAVFNSSDDRILTGSGCGIVKLWEVLNGKCLQTLVGHTDTISSATFNNSGDLIVTASFDGTAKIWNTSSGKCLHTLGESTGGGSPSFAEFNSSGDMVVTASVHTAYIWDTNSGKCLQTLAGHTDFINSTVFNNSGDRVLTASYDETARLWDTTSGECMEILKGHTGSINSAVFNTSGDRVLTASYDETARLWDTTSGECLQVLKSHTGSINSAVFNRSGDMVVTASDDKTARLWDTTSGECMEILKGHTGSINSAVFNTSGNQVVTASADKTAKVYDICLLPKLRSLFLQDDRVSLNQAVVLIGIYEINIYRKLLRKTVGSHVLYFRRLKDRLKGLSTSTEEHVISSDRVVFDFRTCSHLQADYEKLPLEIQRILDKYVRKTASQNDCSTASTTDISDFESASSSEES